MDNEEAIQRIYEESAERVRDADCAFHRYLYSQIDWSSRVIALNGPKGVGKTTMFLQYLKDSEHVESELFDGEKITVANLEPGTTIRIGWRPDRVCIIRYLGEGMFETLESVNAKLGTFTQ